ncbi:MAG: LysM repeat protein [Lentimonas sp.]|jgi:LysM repeat protein
MYMMLKPCFTVPLFCAGILFFSPVVHAQTDQVRVAVANLTQDVNALAQQMRALRLEMEQLRRENAELRAQVASDRSGREMQSQLSSLASAIEVLRREYREADAVQQREVISEVSRQIDALGRETENAIRSVANAVDAQPRVSTPVRFSDDYPKTGVTYTVRSGDTLSQIAREHGSATKHIQNANKIVNPAKDLMVGQTIFIPIKE